jgi:hypothetical protein
MAHLRRLHGSQQAGCTLLSFFECYSGYHQIALKEKDQSKASFITLFSAYCYKNNVLWTQERRRYLSKSYSNMPRETDW